MHVARGGYCGIAPLPDGNLNVAVVSRLDAPGTAALNATDFFERWIDEHREVATVLADCTRLTPVRGVGPIGSRTARAWAPGCMLVGDAASFFDPFTGEGIYRALRSAMLATTVGVSALRSDTVGAAGLEPYAALRRKIFLQKSAVTALVQLFVQYPLLMEYALPRLSSRSRAANTLSAVLGDIEDAGRFLRPTMLWAALRP
jgi:flavin-dependent dehydrogenase